MISKYRSLLGLSLTLIALSASGQSVTGSGSLGTVPVFTGSSTLGNSPITTTSSGNVGIGTTSPSVPLEISTPGAGNPSVLKVVRTGGNVPGEGPVLEFDDYANSWPQGHIYTSMTNLQSPASAEGKLILGSHGRGGTGTSFNDELTLFGGAVGVGTTSPSVPLEISTPGAGNPSVLKVVRTGGNVPGEGPVLEFDDYANSWPQGHIYTSMTNLQSPASAEGKLILGSHGRGGTGTSFNDELTLFGGAVGIGMTSPSAKLEVNGSVKLTSGSGASIIFADGSSQSTAWTGSLCGGDYAESVDVTGGRANYGPGDVLVIDPNNPGKFLKSAEPYSTSVMGIYSTKPGVLGRRQTGTKSPGEVPMAMIGIVPAKVSAENGSIKPGDLLVTASIPGYAMKGTDRSRMLGAVIGKALGSLDSGTGVIEVGVTLQ